VTAYTLGNVARICKISPSRLRYWNRTALLRPSGRVDSRPAFEFRDLVSVRAVRELVERGVPLQRIRKGVEDVRGRVPELERPLGALREWGAGSGRVVFRHAGVLMEPGGQTLLEFDAPGEERVAPLARLRDPSLAQALARQEALDWFERGCRLDTERATFAEAIEAYGRALDADPDFADAHCNLGSIYFNQDRRAAARACFERALALEPRHLEANLNLAALLEEEGRGEAALRHYKVALAVDPLGADTHVSLALLYEKLGLARRGREHWRRYLQLEPAGAWAELARRRLQAAAPSGAAARSEAEPSEVP
jgi:DNA-binding transcriptional MerR regulator